MRKLTYFMVWWLMHPILKLLFRFQVIGKENVPRQGGFILAVNHQSNFDPPLIAAAMPCVMHFFAKDELFHNVVLGAVLKWFFAIRVRRGKYDPGALNRALEVLRRGGALMFFPEGTRGNGGEFLPPKPGIGLIAKKSRAPIVPAYAHGTSRLKELLFARRGLVVVLGKPIAPEETDRFPGDKNGYLSLAEYVMEKIGALRAGVLTA